MGRILKKKSSARKKRNKLGNNEAVSAQGGDTSIASAPGADAKKKQRQNKPAAKQASKKEGSVEKAFQFLREVKAELKKVTWPSRKQAMGSTIVVIVLVFIVSFFLWLADSALSFLVLRFLK